MPKKYYLQETGTRGPAYTREDIEQRYQAAQINGDTLCWPDDFFSIGWKPLRTFFPHFHSPSLAQEQQGEDQEHREKDADQNREVAFDCVDCGTTLRLRRLQDHTAYRCPSCKTEYKVMQANPEQQVFLVVPASRVHKHSASTPPNPKKPISPKAREALETFGLGEAATFEQVRRAYREHIKQYHPDTVAHLGPELRSLAEMKTKQFNSAYHTLEQFFAT